MQPLVIQDGAYSASLDGITLDEQLILEVKCPVRGRRSELWQDVTKGVVPENYRVQIQHQLMVSGAALAHLWVFDGTEGVLIEVTRDDLMMVRIRQAWDAFQVYLDEDRPPPMVEGDVLLHDDVEWLEAAQVYIRAKQAADLAGGAVDIAKKALLGLTRHPREEGGGVLVTRFVKQGNVDYKQVSVLAGVDLDQYRGPTREESRITIK